MPKKPNLIAPNLIAEETSRLRTETMRLIGLSQAERETAEPLAPWVAAVAQYRIRRRGTHPESWVIEHLQAGGDTQPLILFDSLADAERVLDHFAARKRVG